MKKRVISLLISTNLLCVGGLAAADDNPIWLERDSATAVKTRIQSDFPLSVSEATELVKKQYAGLKDRDIQKYIKKRYLETMTIDGKQKVHRKAVRNLGLLCPDIRGEWHGRGANATVTEVAIVDSIVTQSRGIGEATDVRNIKYRFSIDVPRHEFLEGDTLRVWMPVPLESERQHGVKILSSVPSKYILSKGSQSEHNTIYFEMPIGTDSDSILHFEYVGEYSVSSQYYSPEYIMKNIMPYNKESELYKKYTSEELPHIISCRLAQDIVGKETCPFRQSELVYDYIVKNYPWAGAREYSTIPCIPQYVLDEKHGDCGQVALLYISLMRTLGVPARWESGWMLHPGEKNLHDWAEVYFEGVGWVPVDVSFGRYCNSDSQPVRNFYSTGMDSYRFATNKGIGSPLYPQKKYLRSETVDFQVGEVECSKGNIFYPGWTKKLEILSMSPVESKCAAANKVIADVKKLYAPDKRQIVYEVSSKSTAGQVTVKGKVSEKPVKDKLFKALHDANVEAVDSVVVLPSDRWAQVRISVACFRVTPGHSAEMATQGIMGMPVRLLEKHGDWWRAQTPDGYIAYVIDNSLVEKSDEQMDKWRDAERVVVTSLWQTHVFNTPDAGVRNIVSDVVNGVILEGHYSKEGEFMKVLLPDGREGYVRTADVTPIAEWASRPFNAEKILDVAYSMEGTPYLWGGTSIKTLDCSGLAKVSYYANGIILMRDASQQATTGKLIKAENWRKCKAGDLLFFGNAKTRRVTHVGIYDHDGNYIHSSGRVKRNSVDPESPMYLSTAFLHASRIDGCEGTRGITKVIDHSWYFDKHKYK